MKKSIIKTLAKTFAIMFFIISLVSCEIIVEDNRTYRGPIALVKSIELVHPNKKLCTLQFGEGVTREFVTIILPDTTSFTVGDSLEFVKYKK